MVFRCKDTTKKNLCQGFLKIFQALRINLLEIERNKINN